MTATVARRLGLSTNIVDGRAATIKRPQPHGPQLVSTLGSAVVLSGSGLGTWLPTRWRCCNTCA
jgi:hypothetical protein